MGRAADVVVLVPMLGRPQSVGPLAQSLDDTDPEGRAHLLFVTSAEDVGVIGAIDDLGLEQIVVDWPVGPGDYARKINLGASRTREPWIFTGASDLRFTPDWIPFALDVDSRERFAVIGTNDLGNSWTKRGIHSTHSFIRRDYIIEAVIDEPGAIYSTAYEHNFVDRELIDYASFRLRFRSARKSTVEHLHPDWDKGDLDDTYRRGKAGFARDAKLFLRRQRMWRGDSPEERRRLARERVTRNRSQRLR